MKGSMFLVLVCLSLISAESIEDRRKKCLPGDNHKDGPAREDSLQACQAYKENSCCSSEFTQQLTNPPVRSIGNFSWTHCNNTLSPRCEAYMVHVECFYRCSHNAIFWKNPFFPSAIRNAPVCASFCDSWFDACKDDLTCAENWLTGFNFSADGANTCTQPCRNFSDFYRNGKELCENMWRPSFEYKETDCLQLNFTAPNPNDKLVERLFGNETTRAPDTTRIPDTTESRAFVFTATRQLYLLIFIPFLASLL